MANLGTWYSGTTYAWNDGDYGFSAQARMKVELISQDPATNTSVIRYTSAVYWSGDSLIGPSFLLYDTCAGQVLYNANIRMGPDISPPTLYNGLRYCITRDKTITHDANGNASFNASHSWGSASVSGSYTLPQINRRATITSVDNFTVGGTTNIYFSNPAGYWLLLDFFVWGGGGWAPIFTRQLGQAQYFTIGFSGAEIEAMYAQLGTATTGSGLFRLRTYTDSGYTNQFGTHHDMGVTLYVDTSQTVAYITNNVDFLVERNPTLQIHNPRNYYLRVNLRMGGQWIFSYNIGQVSSYTTAFTPAQIQALYSQMKAQTSKFAEFIVWSFSDSGYANEIGYRIKELAVVINSSINRPIFTNYDLVSEDKEIIVKDSYNNELATTTTNTLTGSNERIIKGVSQGKVSITSSDKMVAKNQANPVKYRLVNGDKLIEASYKASGTVSFALDKITSKDAVVTAYDSRGYATSVQKSFSNMANYVAPTAWNLSFRRDNNVEDKTKLLISGKFWKEYFGGGSNGVQNTITAHYRYKETTQAWGSQTWNSLAVTSNSEGDISFNDYINGDLGVNGFNREKSYSVEVRLYDKISSLIVSGVLNKGTPLLDWTTNGVAIKGRYDESEGGELQIKGQDIMNIILNYSHPIGTIYETTSSDLNTVAKMNAHFGGTWEEYGSGRMLVGKAGSGTFNTIGKTGGAETVNLQHNHALGDSGYARFVAGTNEFLTYMVNKAWDSNTRTAGSMSTSAGAYGMSKGVGLSGTTNNAQGSTNILPPFVVVYRYRRTA